MTKPIQHHLMFDIETLNTKPDAIVLSIGAVVFTREGIVDTFSINLSMKEQLDKGRTLSESTFYWWMQQTQEASKAVSTDLHGVRTGLGQFYMWLNRLVDMNSVLVWGNGAQFDNVIMKHLLNQYGYSDGKLWKFYNDRCFRTYINSAKVERVKPITAHVALDDAIAQAQTLINHWSKDDATVGV